MIFQRIFRIFKYTATKLSVLEKLFYSFVCRENWIWLFENCWNWIRSWFCIWPINSSFYALTAKFSVKIQLFVLLHKHENSKTPFPGSLVKGSWRKRLMRARTESGIFDNPEVMCSDDVEICCYPCIWLWSLTSALLFELIWFLFLRRFFLWFFGAWKSSRK